jgi:hypothetical protein
MDVIMPKAETLLQKLMVSVISTAIISAGASGVASYVEIKLLRNDLSTTVKSVEETADKVDRLESRVLVLEERVNTKN